MAQSLSNPLTAAQPRRIVGTLWIGMAVLLLAFALVFVGAQWWTRSPGESSPETTFARDMSAHHTQAVAMALAIRDRTTDPDLRIFALDIILTQQAQIGQMQGWLGVWSLPLTGAGAPMQGMGEMMGMATQQQVNDLATLPLPQAEVSFLQLMTRHHQGGVMMAQDALKETQNPVVVRLANAIIAGQQSEISAMKAMLKVRGAEPLAPLQPMNMGQMQH